MLNKSSFKNIILWLTPKNKREKTEQRQILGCWISEIRKACSIGMKHSVPTKQIPICSIRQCLYFTEYFTEAEDELFFALTKLDLYYCLSVWQSRKYQAEHFYIPKQRMQKKSINECLLNELRSFHLCRAGVKWTQHVLTNRTAEEQRHHPIILQSCSKKSRHIGSSKAPQCVLHQPRHEPPRNHQHLASSRNNMRNRRNARTHGSSAINHR
jgi:hypothetical protein